MTTDEIMDLAGQLVVCNVRQLQGRGSQAETREAYVALQSAIEALQADAARYRWLRDTAHHDYLDRLITFATEDWDDQINAAMALDKG